jgi:class 3 adenylate cyclase
MLSSHPSALFRQGWISKYIERFLSVVRHSKKLILLSGLNSGPVTAGVLQGDRARIQLFGDTVNTGK